MNYELFKETQNAQKGKRVGPAMEDPNFFKGTKSPLPSTLNNGGKVVYLYDEIDEVSINRVISELLPIIGSGVNIQLRLKTYGGSLYDCLALIDIVRQYDIPVHVDGYAMSGGFLIFAAAKTRTMSPYSYVMYHDMTYIEYGKRAKHKNELAHSNNLATLYHNLICEYTKVTPKMLKEWDDKQLEWYIDYEEAQKLRIVSQILKTVVIKVPASESHEVEQIEYVDIDAEQAEKKK